MRVLADGKITDIAGILTETGEWKIHMSPYGPLGFGENGVFELDHDMRPQRVVYRPIVGGVLPGQAAIQFLRRNDKTIGVVVGSDKGAALQSLSLDGKVLAEAALDQYTSGFIDGEQLIALGDGYLFSDRQLTWVGTSADRIWQFGPSFERTSGPRWGDRWQYFGKPLLTEGHVFVTSLDGQLFVFDAAEIPRTAGKPRKK